jgi:hypothetical protein
MSNEPIDDDDDGDVYLHNDDAILFAEMADYYRYVAERLDEFSELLEEGLTLHSDQRFGLFASLDDVDAYTSRMKEFLERTYVSQE